MNQGSDTNAEGKRDDASSGEASWGNFASASGISKEKAEKLELLWGTILASAGNPSPDVTLKAYDDLGDDDKSSAAQTLLALSQSFMVPKQRQALGGFASSLSIRTSRLSHLDSSMYGKDIGNADGNDFVIMGTLGRGGMGVVYNARQSSLNRDVAVKMISPEASGKDSYRRKMVSEALVTGELDHPNIIPIYDLGRTETGDLFYAMKIVNGDPWSQSVAGKSERENVEILLRVCDAVALAHDRGIIHRDLKPGNVMLGNYGEVLLMDWGLAVSLDQSDKAEMLCPANAVAGTPAYMAPEMALGDFAAIDKQSDIYLLGGILFEIVTGQRPHRGFSSSDCILSAAENDIAPVVHVDELTRVALRAMATNPEDRYDTVKDFQNAIITVQTHRESHKLVTNADDWLDNAIANGDYHGFAQAIFAYSEAVKLWDGNKEAKDGNLQARMQYALCAYRKGDYDLAFSNVQGLESQEALELAANITAARNDLEARKRRIRFLTRAAIGLTIAVVLILGASTWIVSDRMAREREARQMAGKALEETLVARRNEQLAAQEREAALISERKAQEAALLAAAERENALRREMAALERAEEERRRKEEAEQAHREIERELTRKGHLEDDSWWGFDAAEAKKKQELAATLWEEPATRTVSLGAAALPTAFALIPPGVFVMGSSPTAEFHAPDEYLHRVELHQPFYIALTEVTKAEWRAVVGIESIEDLMPAYNPELTDETLEAFREREFRIWGWRTRPLEEIESRLPATGVSPREVDTLFLSRVSAAGPAGWIIDLPTEAEWEYACRSGTSTDFFNGNIAPELVLPGWMRVNSGVRLHEGMALAANPWGLFDTHGNAGEIVKDYYASDFYRASPEQDPVNISYSNFRVFRGGTFIHDERRCRSASRFTIHMDNRYQQVGLRLVLRMEEFRIDTW